MENKGSDHDSPYAESRLVHGTAGGWDGMGRDAGGGMHLDPFVINC
jgi:hypothetical protein